MNVCYISLDNSAGSIADTLAAENSTLECHCIMLCVVCDVL